MKYLIAVISALVITAGGAATVLAVGGTAPTLTADEATCFQGIIDEGDLFCLLRYELPVELSPVPGSPPAAPEAWCAELTSAQDGCTADPVVPDDNSALIFDTAFVALYSNTNYLLPGGPVLEYEERVPRIGYGLGGIYLSPGNAVTWGDSTTEACVQSSSTLYTSQSQSCIPVLWNVAAADQQSQRDQLGLDLVAALRAIEALESKPVDTYVTNNRVTAEGRYLAVEAFSNITSVIPGTFQAGAVPSISTSFATPTAPLALQDQLDTAAGSSDLPTAFGNLGTILGGWSAGAMGTILFIFFGLAVFVYVQRYTQEFVMPTAALMTVLMVGVYVRAPSISAMAVLGVILAFTGGMFVLRKMPQ